jgi:hypothetical protein
MSPYTHCLITCRLAACTTNSRGFWAHHHLPPCLCLCAPVAPTYSTCPIIPANTHYHAHLLWCPSYPHTPITSRRHGLWVTYLQSIVRDGSGQCIHHTHLQPLHPLYCACGIHPSRCQSWWHRLSGDTGGSADASEYPCERLE